MAQQANSAKIITLNDSGYENRLPKWYEINSESGSDKDERENSRAIFSDHLTDSKEEGKFQTVILV